VRSVAIGWVFGFEATAELNILLLGHFKDHRLFTGFLMGAVTKQVLFALAARAPIVCTGFQYWHFVLLFI
jgi:hypothetical protein